MCVRFHDVRFKDNTDRRLFFSRIHECVSLHILYVYICINIRPVTHIREINVCERGSVTVKLLRYRELLSSMRKLLLAALGNRRWDRDATIERRKEEFKT